MGIGARCQIGIVFIGRQLGQIPLISVVVVIVDPVVNGAADIRKGSPAGGFTPKFVLHVAKEALLGCVVPAVAFAGHGLPQGAVLQELNELHAGVVAALIAVEGGFFAQGDAVISH